MFIFVDLQGSSASRIHVEFLVIAESFQQVLENYG